MDNNIYTVKDMAERVGITDGRIYQLINTGEIRPLSVEELRLMGRPVSIKRPKHLLTEEEVEKFENKIRP